MGPLPPHPADCCVVANIEKIRSLKVPLSGRRKKTRQRLKDAKNSKLESEKLAENQAIKKPIDEQRIQKKLNKLQKQLEVQNPATKKNNTFLKTSGQKTLPVYFSSTVTTRGDAAKPIQLSIKSETMEKKMHKRNLLKDFISKPATATSATAPASVYQQRVSTETNLSDTSTNTSSKLGELNFI